jgi:hypothetical protein
LRPEVEGERRALRKLFRTEIVSLKPLAEFGDNPLKSLDMSLGFPSARLGFPSDWLGFPSGWLGFPSARLGNPSSQP